MSFTNLTKQHREAKKSMAGLIETLADMEGKLVQLPDHWMLLNLESPKGNILSLVVFPDGVKPVNSASLREWIGNELRKKALTQSCYYCSTAFQSRASSPSRLYMWCASCGFSCFNWKA